MTMEKLYEQHTNENYSDLKHLCHIGWRSVSAVYLLTAEFILDNIDSLDFKTLCPHQKLPDNLKLKFLPMYPYTINTYQRLSEQFISDSWETLKSYAKGIANYQRVSPEFRDKYELNQHINHKTIWLYWSDRYKGVRVDGHSKFNWHIKYEEGKIYEPVNNCDCDSLDSASSGLSAWYRQESLDYCNQKLLLLVKIYLKDLGVIVKEDKRIRCRKLTVIDEIT